MIEQTNKEKIIVVLKESVKFARETNFVYDDMFEKHKEVALINNLGKTIKEKIDLFNNMDETSHLFQTIYDCAKLALSNMLEKKYYNYYSAELIMKFNSLEEIFRKKLRPMGVRINSDLKAPEKKKEPIKHYYEENSFQTNNSSFNEHEINEENIVEDIDGLIVEQGVTGKELLERKNKRNEMITALKGTTFE